MKKIISAINRDGIMLVFPIKNDSEPHSIWSELYPKSKMRWDWDVTGDDRVVKLWQLKTDLSTTKEVIYTKWYQNRATYFSKELFQACLRIEMENPTQLSRDSKNLLETLISDSPLSTKQLKALAELQGRMFESTYNKSMRPLWDHFQIVAFGEFDDSSFPSLGMGATQTLFEDLYENAKKMNLRKAKALINEKMPLGSKFRKYFDRVIKN